MITMGKNVDRFGENLLTKHTRQEIDWEKMYVLSIDPDKARKMHESAQPKDPHTCTMCGNLCAMRNMNLIMAGEKIKLHQN